MPPYRVFTFLLTLGYNTNQNKIIIIDFLLHVQDRTRVSPRPYPYNRSNLRFHLGTVNMPFISLTLGPQPMIEGRKGKFGEF